MDATLLKVPFSEDAFTPGKSPNRNSGILLLPGSFSIFKAALRNHHTCGKPVSFCKQEIFEIFMSSIKSTKCVMVLKKISLGNLMLHNSLHVMLYSEAENLQTLPAK